MMYDAFSSDYDRFNDWPARLAFELPFLERLLSPGARVLDAACGTGMHAIALAQRGFSAAGADLSAGMIERARMNASAVGAAVRFEAAGFGELARTFGLGAFDALLCLGNSLPHLLTPQSLSAALDDFAAALRPGGLLLIQNRNFDAVLASRSRWMEPQAHREGEHEWLFVRFYDFQPDGLIAFNILELRRGLGEKWQQSVLTTHLSPQRQADLTAALAEAGFSEVGSFGSLAGEPFDPRFSGNLVLTARRV